MSLAIVKVTPAAVTQGPETNNEKETNPTPKLSISGVSDSNPHLEVSSNTPGKLSKVKPSDSSANDSFNHLSTKSQRQRKYNASRLKSSDSFFTSRSDVFEIDSHVERLSHQLQKNYRSHSQKSNTWNAKRPSLKRFFMCSSIRSPNVFSSDEMCLYAKVGDLLLFREGTSFEQRYLSPEVMRGMKSSLDGKYIPKIRQIKLWNHVGVVVSLYSEEVGEYVKFIMYADDIGLRLRKLSEVTNSCVLAHDLCSLRPVNIKNSKQQQLYSTFVDDIESIALLALNGKLLWSHFEQAERCQGDERSTIDEDLLTLLDHPIISRFQSLFTQRMHRLSFSPSQEGIQEASRLFRSMLAVHLENEKAKAEEEIGGSIKSSIKSSFGKSTESETLPLTMIFKSLSAMNEDEGESKQGDTEFGMRLRNMLLSMDNDNDGHVSLDEFIDAFLNIPCDIIPVEFDLPSIAMGEMVACLFVSLGVFKEDVLDDKFFFHPQSFSSASSSESKKIQLESTKSKKASAIARITKTMLLNPKKTKFKKDILLRVR